MARLIDGQEQKQLDQAFCEKTGLPMLTLMEQAASALTEQAVLLLQSDGAPVRPTYFTLQQGAQSATRPPQGADGDASDVLVVSGSGNNGGDGWASARQLMARGYRVAVLDGAPESALTEDAAACREAYRRLGGRVITDPADMEGRQVRVVIDALFGTGFSPSRPLQAPAKALFARMAELKKAGAYVLACDVPSGLDAGTGAVIPETVAADVTVTFGRNKVGLVTHPGCLQAGEVVVAPISMNDAFVEDTLGDATVSSLDLDLYPLLPPRPADAHKGRFGRALLIGGAENMTGALILAARACMKTGAGYTMLRVPSHSLPILAEAVPSALMSAVPDSGSGTKKDLPDPTVIAVGPGAGDAPWVVKALKHLIPASIPLIIDADGLNALARMPGAASLFEERAAAGYLPVVLTPHHVEFKRLAPDLADMVLSNRLEAARTLARRWHVIVVLKGMATVIAFPDGRARINTSGGSGLSKAGSGDVLTGIIAGLAAQSLVGRDPSEDAGEAAVRKLEDAVCRAVYAHGRAAEWVTMLEGNEASVTPEDIIGVLGGTLAETREERARGTSAVDTRRRGLPVQDRA